MSKSAGERGLVLASGSPRRRELLAQLVDSFEIIISGVPEPVVEALDPARNILRIARAKAVAVVPLAGNRIVLAADTDVVLDGVILGKPVDADDAGMMLRKLRGREHEVITAVVVVDSATGGSWEAVARSLVRIRELTDAEIDQYVETGEPLDKAGGYAIQGAAASMVESVEGSYTNVIGLPLGVTRGLLEYAGAAMRK